MKTDAVKEHPSFFAVLPAGIRYDGRLSEFQKLLFVEITALADKEGFCWAGNAYFARLYGKDKKRISKCIMQLKNAGYITCNIAKELGNQRKIFVTAKPFLPVAEKNDSYRGNESKGMEQKNDSPTQQKDDYSNTSNNSVVSSSKTTAASKKNIENNETGFLQIRNEAMKKTEVMNSGIKREMAALKNVDEDTFTKMVCTFSMVVNIIEHQNLKPYLYYPVWNYDFVQFLQKINWFCVNYNPHMVINKLAKKEEVKTINRQLQNNDDKSKQEKTVIKMIDREFAKSGWKKVADILNKK
jgi:hypothetical protein